MSTQTLFQPRPAAQPAPSTPPSVVPQPLPAAQTVPFSQPIPAPVPAPAAAPVADPTEGAVLDTGTMPQDNSHAKIFKVLAIATVVMAAGIAYLIFQIIVNSPAYKLEQFTSVYQTAHASEAQGDWAAVLQDADQMQKMDPNAFATYALRADAEYATGKYTDAIPNLSCAVQLVAAPTGAAEMKTYRGLSASNKAATATSVAAALHANMARTEYALGLYGPALGDCKAALRLDPSCRMALYFSVLVNERMNQDKVCVDNATTLIKLDPKSAVNWALRSRAYRSLGQVDLAKADAARASTIQQSDLVGSGHPVPLDDQTLQQLAPQGDVVYD